MLPTSHLCLLVLPAMSLLLLFSPIGWSHDSRSLTPGCHLHRKCTSHSRPIADRRQSRRLTLLSGETIRKRQFLVRPWPWWYFPTTRGRCEAFLRKEKNAFLEENIHLSSFASLQRDHPQRPPRHVQRHPPGVRLRGLLRIQRLPLQVLGAGGLQLHPQHHVGLALLHHQQGRQGERAPRRWRHVGKGGGALVRSHSFTSPCRSKFAWTAPEAATTTKSRS